MTKIKHFLAEEAATTSVEYCLMLALVIAVCIGAISTFGGKTGKWFTTSTTEITAAFNQ